MILTVLLLLLSSVFGIVLTYLYDEKAWVSERIIEGLFVGHAALGLVGFLVASVLGLHPLGLIETSLLLLAPIVWVFVWKKKMVASDATTAKRWVHTFVQKPGRAVSYVVVCCAIVGVLGLTLKETMREEADGIYTSSIDNYADLTLHIGIINSFVKAQSFPPMHPDYAGARLTYPFIVDFIAAMFVASGLSISWAIFIQNMVLVTALVALLFIWSYRLTGNKAAAALTPALFLLCGGLGWTMLWWESKDKSIWQLLQNLPHDYSSYQDKLRWGTPIVYWFIPMRSMLLGVPLVVVVGNMLWRMLTQATDGGISVRELIRHVAQFNFVGIFSRVGRDPLFTTRIVAAGAITGLMLLIHGHSFLTLMFVVLIFSVLFIRFIPYWSTFFVTSFLLVIPQLVWFSHDTSVSAKAFIGLLKSWIPTEPNLFRLWLTNTGFFIPLLMGALLLPRLIPRKLKLFYLPFLLLFFVANFLKLAPWEWDNIKVFAYWYLFSVPLVAVFLVYLWRKHSALKVAAVALLFSLLASGVLDNWRMISGANNLQVFDETALRMADIIEQRVEPGSVILTSPSHNTAVYLTGAQMFMGYPGRIWTHGMLYEERENEVKEMYQGTDNTWKLLDEREIDYVLIGDQEFKWATENNIELYHEYFAAFDLVGEVDNTRLYKIP